MARSVGVRLTALLAILGIVLVLAGPAAAHERRTVGAYVMSVGWADEPPYAGAKNGVQLLLKDASGKAVTDLPEDLSRPRLDRNLVSREVRSPDTQPFEAFRNARQLPDILHGDPGASRAPVVLLRV